MERGQSQVSYVGELVYSLLRTAQDLLDGQLPEMTRAWQTFLKVPSTTLFRPKIDICKPQCTAEIIRDLALYLQVVFELVVVLDDLISPSFKVVDERALSFEV